MQIVCIPISSADGSEQSFVLFKWIIELGVEPRQYKHRMKCEEDINIHVFNFLWFLQTDDGVENCVYF